MTTHAPRQNALEQRRAANTLEGETWAVQIQPQGRAFDNGFLGRQRDPDVREPGQPNVQSAPDLGLSGWNDLRVPLLGPQVQVLGTAARNQHCREFLERLFPVKGGWDESDVFEAPPVPGHLVVWTKQDKNSHWVTWRELNKPHWHWEYETDPTRLGVDLSASMDVYFGVGLQGQQSTGRGTAGNVVAIPGLWADIDVQSSVHARSGLPPTKEAALALACEFPIHPTIVVDTGYGLQVYWLFPGLWYLDDEAERQRAAGLSQRFQTHLARLASAHGWTIDNTSDLSRVLRLPGTLNHKEDVPKMVRVVWLYNRRRRDPSHFLALLPETGRATQGTCRVAPESTTDEDVQEVRDERRYVEAAVREELGRVTGSLEGERNNTLFRSAAALGRLIPNGHADEGDLREQLEAAAVHVGLSPHEAARTVSSGLATGARDPRHLIETHSAVPALSRDSGEPRNGLNAHDEDTPDTNSSATSKASLTSRSIKMFRPSEARTRAGSVPGSIVTGLLPVGLTSFLGRPGEGKSTLLRQLVIAVATGTQFLASNVVKSGAAYISLEEPTGQLQQALERTAGRLGVPEDDVLLLGSDEPFSLDALPQLMEQHRDVKVWVIDPLPAAWHPTDSFGYAQEYAVGHNLKRMADTYGVAVIVTSHAGKRRDANAVTAGTGTVGLPGAADNRWLIERKRGGAVFRMAGGRKLAGRSAQALSFDGIRFHPSAATPQTVTPSMSRERAELRNALSAAGGPLSPKEVSAAVGKNDERGRDAVKALLSKMHRDGQVTRVGDGTYEV